MRIVKGIAAFAAVAALVLPFGTGAASAAFSTDVPELVSAQTKTVNSTIQQAAEELRENLKARREEFAVTVEYGIVKEKSQIDEMINIAVSETSSPSEGDYIRFNMAGFSYNTTNNHDGIGMDINFDVEYNASAAEEKIVDKQIADLTDELRLVHLNDYEKCAAVCQWVRSNVVYEQVEGDRSIFSAYGALVDHKAVCQGISVLIYRLLRENGVRCRVVPGKGNGGNHAWNMVCIDGNWEYMDATWDALLGRPDYIFFLRGSKDFDSLSVGNYHDDTDFGSGDSPLYYEYTSGNFAQNYPVQPYRYATFAAGDIDGNGSITSNDASIALSAYSRMAATGRSGLTSAQSQAGDIYRLLSVDSKCASGILSYYSYISTGGTLSLDKFLES